MKEEFEDSKICFVSYSSLIMPSIALGIYASPVFSNPLGYQLGGVLSQSCNGAGSIARATKILLILSFPLVADHG